MGLQQGVFALVLGLSVLAVAHSGRITPAQNQRMQQGIAAGRKFANQLARPDIYAFPALAAIPAFVGKWVDGMETVFGVIKDIAGNILPEEDTRILDAINRGFSEVNGRLDSIKGQLNEIKKQIQWGQMVIKFEPLEFAIRLLDSKLQEAMRAPNKEDGMNNFLRIYYTQYNSAGFALYDSIVSNDRIFSRNLLRAAQHFSMSNRPQTRAFMKGLLSLLVKAAAIEIAEERFTGQNRGESNLWREKLMKVRDAMVQMDTELTNQWVNYKNEVTKQSGQMRGSNHELFATSVYRFLSKKYNWRKWVVLSYNGIKGMNLNAVRLYQTNMLYLEKLNGRNIVVSSSDNQSPTPFNPALAKTYIKDRRCTRNSYACRQRLCEDEADLSPKYGAAKVVFRDSIRFYLIGAAERWVSGEMSVKHRAFGLTVGRIRVFYMA